MSVENTIEIVHPKNIEFMQLNNKLHIPVYGEGEVLCLNNCSISIENNNVFCSGFSSDFVTEQQFKHIVNIFKTEQVRISGFYTYIYGKDAEIKVIEYLFYKGIPFKRTLREEVNYQALREDNYTLDEIAEDLILQREYEEILNIEELQKQYPNGGKVKCRYLDENWNIKEKTIIILPELHFIEIKQGSTVELTGVNNGDYRLNK